LAADQDTGVSEFGGDVSEFAVEVLGGSDEHVERIG
jgi:hypothetical protein